MSEKLEKITIGLIGILIAISAFQIYQIEKLEDGHTNSTVKKTQSNPGESKAQQIYQELVPEKGTKTGYRLTYSSQGMEKLVESYNQISLEGENKQRYITIGTNSNTSCEYCCGATNAVTEDGKSACGCKHNYALAGLIKYLVKNTEKTNQEILSEIQDWKAYFFPKETVKQEIEERGLERQVQLPEMRGGC